MQDLSFKANIATEGNSEASFISGLNGNASVSGQAQILLKKSERNQIRAVSVGGNLLAGLLGGKGVIATAGAVDPIDGIAGSSFRTQPGSAFR